MFEQQSQSKIVGFPDGNVISFCPTIDLLVISMNRTSLWVFRLNGERIYSINNKVLILHHQWSPDGKFFALTGIDKSCNIYDTNNGSLLRTFNFDGGVECLDWNEQVLDESNELFKIDILDNLPKLDDFSNNDGLMYSLVSTKSDWFLIFNSLIKFKFPKLNNVVRSLSCDIFNHFFLTAREDKLQLVNIASEYDPNVVRIIVIFYKLQLILDNITSSIDSLTADVPEFFKVFDRYLSNYHDILKEGGIYSDTEPSKPAVSNSIIKSFSRILSTSIIPQPLTDYWLNQFGERARKRLHKLGNQIYDTIRDVSFKRIVNYIEKLIILLTELKAVVEFNKIDQDIDYGIKLTDIANLITSMQSHVKLVYKLIWDCNEEQELFNEFIIWSKYLIDLLSKEKNEEELLIPITFDFTKLMDYFYNNMCGSKLAEYLKINVDVLDVIDIPKEQAKSIYSDLQHSVNNSGTIFHSFEGYFVKSFEQKGCTDVAEFKYDKLLNFSYSGDNAIIYCLEQNNLKYAKFDPKSPTEMSFNEVSLHDKVIDYKVISNQIVLLTHSDMSNYLQLHNLEDLLSGDFEPLHKQQVSNKDPKHVILNANRNYGCLLDSNGKDYSVFLL